MSHMPLPPGAGGGQVSERTEVSLAPTTLFRSGSAKSRSVSFFNRNFFFKYRSPWFSGPPTAQPSLEQGLRQEPVAGSPGI